MNPSQGERFGRYLEQFATGEVFQHWPGKTICESDNNLFCLLTMNHHPVHIDANYARQTQHKGILVNGALVFSVAVGMSVADISGRAIANLDYERVTHLAPVFVGDTLYAETRVLDVRNSRTKGDRGVVYVETKARNQEGKDVLAFRRHVLVPRAPGWEGRKGSEGGT